MDELFKQILQETPGHTKRFVNRSMDVSDQIMAILKLKGHNQKFLADKLGKNESEISKWLSGNHNFTLRTLAKIEDILNEDVLIAPIYWQEYKGAFAPECRERQLYTDKTNVQVFSSGVSMKVHVNTAAQVSSKPEKDGEFPEGKSVA